MVCVLQALFPMVTCIYGVCVSMVTCVHGDVYLWCVCIYGVCIAGVVSDGDVSAVCQSEAVLSEQLADVPHPVSCQAA